MDLLEKQVYIDLTSPALKKECPEGGDHQELRTGIPGFVCLPWER